MESSPPRRTLVLVVDRDVRAARVLGRMLEDDGFAVEVVADGAAAIGRLARRPVPDALVTDLRLPHADGVAVAEYARSRRAGMPIVVVTGYPLLAKEMEGRLDPPPAVHVKPIDYAWLREQLRSRGVSSPLELR